MLERLLRTQSRAFVLVGLALALAGIVAAMVGDLYASGAGSLNFAGVSNEAIGKVRQARIKAGNMAAIGSGQNVIGVGKG